MDQLNRLQHVNCPTSTTPTSISMHEHEYPNLFNKPGYEKRDAYVRALNPDQWEHQFGELTPVKLIEYHSDDIRRLVLTDVKKGKLSPADVEDLIQDLFEYAADRVDRYDPMKSSHKRWLQLMYMATKKNHTRRLKRKDDCESNETTLTSTRPEVNNQDSIFENTIKHACVDECTKEETFNKAQLRFQMNEAQKQGHIDPNVNLANFTAEDFLSLPLSNRRELSNFIATHWK